MPDELLEATSLCGPEGYVAERIAAFREAGVTHLQVTPVPVGDQRPVDLIAKVKELGRLSCIGLVVPAWLHRDQCCTGPMLYRTNAVPDQCCTGPMLYRTNAVPDRCCAGPAWPGIRTGLTGGGPLSSR